MVDILRSVRVSLCRAVGGKLILLAAIPLEADIKRHREVSRYHRASNKPVCLEFCNLRCLVGLVVPRPALSNVHQ